MTHVEPERINWPVVLVIIIGTFMAILDGSIVNVAIPKIMAIFNTNTDTIEWVLTSYLLALGIVMPLSGYLGDTYGYKKMYFLALSLFVLGSALCGLAWSVNSLIAARVVQALGGGILQPMGMAIIYKCCPRSKIGLVLGVWGIASMAAPTIGPTLGGYLVEYVNWRSIFYLNVPIGIINLFLVAVIMKETPLLKGKTVDYVGVLTSSVGFFCLLLALSDGASDGWTSPYIVSLFFMAAVSLTVLVYNELHHPEPLLDLSLFKNFIFSISTVIGCVLAIGMFGGMFLIPILLQNVLGQTAMKTGLITLPMALASGLTMPFSGRIFDRYGPKGIVLIGLSLLTWTTYMMTGFNTMTPFRVISGWMTLRGMAMGLTMMPVMTAGMNTVPQPLVGRASALSNVIRQVSASFGIAMFTTVMQNRQAYHFANLAQSLNMNGNEALQLQGFAQGLAVKMGLSYSQAQSLALTPIMQQLAKFSMTRAIGDCFLLAAVLCFVALLMAPLLKDARQKAVTPAASPARAAASRS